MSISSAPVLSPDALKINHQMMPDLLRSKHKIQCVLFFFYNVVKFAYACLITLVQFFHMMFSEYQTDANKKH